MARRGWVSAAALLVAVVTMLGVVGSLSRIPGIPAVLKSVSMNGNVAGAVERHRAPRRVLAVCSGNTCRSAMFMAALRLELKRSNRTDILVDSAGSGPRAGERLPASEHARALFPGMLESHRSMSISNRSMSSYDRILCMTNQHRSDVLAQCEGEVAAASKLSADAPPPGPLSAPAPPEASLCTDKGPGHLCGMSNTESPPASENSTDAALHQEGVGASGECAAKIAVFPGELEDPIGKPVEVYASCAGRIKEWVIELVRDDF